METKKRSEFFMARHPKLQYHRSVHEKPSNSSSNWEWICHFTPFIKEPDSAFLCDAWKLRVKLIDTFLASPLKWNYEIKWRKKSKIAKNKRNCSLGELVKCWSPSSSSSSPQYNTLFRIQYITLSLPLSVHECLVLDTLYMCIGWFIHSLLTYVNFTVIQIFSHQFRCYFYSTFLSNHFIW